jgi:hypothetical protein
MKNQIIILIIVVFIGAVGIVENFFELFINSFSTIFCWISVGCMF